MKKTLLIVVTVLVGLFAVVTVFVALSISSPVARSDDGTYTVQLAMIRVPIAQEAPLVESPNQYLGLPHREPEFDTSGLGADLTFKQATSDLSGLDPDRVVRAVYLGQDANGEPYYIWQSGSSDLRQMIGQIIADFGSVGRFGSSHGALVTGDALWESAMEDSIAERGLADGSLQMSSAGPATITLEWHALPQEIAAVVYYQAGEPVGWQRPISGTAAFYLEVDNLDDPEAIAQTAEMVALTRTGEEWNRYGWTTGFER